MFQKSLFSTLYHKLIILKIEGIYKLQAEKCLANVHVKNFLDQLVKLRFRRVRKIKFRNFKKYHQFTSTSPKGTLSDNYCSQGVAFEKSQQCIKTT